MVADALDAALGIPPASGGECEEKRHLTGSRVASFGHNRI